MARLSEVAAALIGCEVVDADGRRLGRTDEARDAYERALELAHAQPERRFLERRLAELPSRG